MANSKTQQMAIKGRDAGSMSIGLLYSRHFEAGERMTRALKVLGVCLLLAVITLFIPLAHFFLVPLFLIAGPVMAVMKYKVDSELEKVEGKCPECGRAINIELDPADKIPKRTYCPSCNKPLQLMYHAGSTEERVG